MREASPPGKGIPMLTDFHTHSRFSYDGAPDATPDALCRAAIDRGLSCLAITDHCDASGEVEGLYARYDRKAAYAAVAEAKEKYRGSLRVAYGIELGEATQAPEYAADLLRECPFDYVLGSMHNLSGVPDFCYIGFSHEDFPQALIDQLFSRYLDELTSMCSFPGIHTLAHLTYPLRYIARGGKTIDLSPFEERFRRLFAEMIDRDIAMEINASTLSSALGETMPPVSLLRLYRDCGGKLVTVGSDAHAPARIGCGIKEANRMLSDNGFDRVTVFFGGRPEFVPV